ncbi:hypothetical protein J4402_02675 [Candidatus Pacearchaeota archaeon]|nr:hypothetical protein [Candidatus Pacearchaeota archaeon]
MRKLYDWFAGILVASGTAVGLVYFLEEADKSNKERTASSIFQQGLQFKVEEVADQDADGKLNVNEMASVYETLGEDPAEKLRGGFHLFAKESQRYLKAKGQFDPQTDSDYKIGQKHPFFLKAEKEGKPVYYPPAKGI